MGTESITIIAPDEQTRLGIDAVAGARTPDATSTFSVVVGPVDNASFMALEPRGRRMAELVELVRLYMDSGLDFDVQVVLRREDVPESRLGEGAPRLGWNGWVRQTPMGRDAGETVYKPNMNEEKLD